MPTLVIQIIKIICAVGQTGFPFPASYSYYNQPQDPVTLDSEGSPFYHI